MATSCPTHEHTRSLTPRTVSALRPALLVCLFLLLAGSSAQAARLTADKARLAARNFHREIREVAAFSDGNDSVGHLVKFAPNGYALLSTDDQAPPVKLYSENGSFESLPAGFKAVVLTEMREDLAALADKKALPAKGASAYAGQWKKLLDAASDVQPSGPLTTSGTTLVTTTWNQDDPYNIYCPAASGGPAGKAYAGCVATAMAQILRYHRQPIAITGSHSYTDYGACAGTRAFTDAGTGAYNWASMPLSISTSSTTAEKQAVGQLIYHCGVSVNMDFEATGSSSAAADAPTALADHFGYTSNGYFDRSSYGNSAWYNLLVADIDQNRPILYAIWTAGYGVGHAVVCDGYRNGNEMHLNFGWSGAYSAWYNMDSVSANGYAWTIHSAVLGIRSLTYTLELTSTGAGTGTVKVNGTSHSLPWSGNFAAGSTVTLEAAPDSGYVLGAWSGDLSGNVNPTSIVMNSHKNVGVNLTPPFGSMRVIFGPRGAAAAAAGWRRTSTSTWYGSGETDPVAPVGTYAVEFKDVPGWTKPANITGLSVSEGALTTASAAYTMTSQITIGTGTSSTWYYPLDTNRNGGRTQSIYLASDIGAPRTITGLALDVTMVPGMPMNNFTIRMKPTTRLDYNASQNFETSGWTTTYQANRSVTTTGWAQFDFTMPYIFKYTDANNVMVDISFLNSTWNAPGYCRYSDISGHLRVIYDDSDGFAGDPLNWSGPTGYYDFQIPNIRLTVVPHADANRDFTVNFKDWAVIAAKWNQSSCSAANQWCNWADVNRSGAVNAADLVELASHWLD